MPPAGRRKGCIFSFSKICLEVEGFSVHDIEKPHFAFPFGSDTEVEFNFAVPVKDDISAQALEFLPVAEEPGEPHAGVTSGSDDELPLFHHPFQTGVLQFVPGEDEHFHIVTFKGELSLAVSSEIGMFDGVIVSRTTITKSKRLNETQ